MDLNELFQAVHFRPFSSILVHNSHAKCDPLGINISYLLQLFYLMIIFYSDALTNEVSTELLLFRKV